MKQEALIRGHFLWTDQERRLQMAENAWLYCREGKIVSLSEQEPEGLTCPHFDYSNCLIVPPFADLHLHAAQYVNCGLGYDMTLLNWLKAYTYPEESRYAELDYAERIFRRLRRELWYHGTLRSVIFVTLHAAASLRLMQLLAEAGLEAYVGKVNMNRFAIPELSETTEASLRDSECLLAQAAAYGPGVRPIVTPRFAPSCTPDLLRGLGDLVEKYGLPVQSHLNETPAEVAWVQELFPERTSYLDVYDYYGLLPQGRSIMAHCIYNKPEEERLLREREVWIAHCAASNCNLASGIMQTKRYLAEGFHIGIGSDLSGGDRLCMQDNLSVSLKASCLWARQSDFAVIPLSYQELFYLATRGGSSFFGQDCGAFAAGMSADFLVVDDRESTDLRDFSLEDRLQRFLLLGSGSWLRSRWLRGRELPDPGV